MSARRLLFLLPCLHGSAQDGYKGQTKLDSFSSLSDAKAAFTKVFLEKTGNIWGSKFVAQDGKYVYLELGSGKNAPTSPAVAVSPPKASVSSSAPKVIAAPPPKSDDLDFDFEEEALAAAPKPSNASLDDHVMGLVKMMFDRQAMEKVLASFNFNLEKESFSLFVHFWIWC